MFAVGSWPGLGGPHLSGVNASETLGRIARSAGGNLKMIQGSLRVLLYRERTRLNRAMTIPLLTCTDPI